MNDQIKRLLDEIVRMVMEQMAFMFAQCDPEERTPPARAEFVRATLAFYGPMNGRLTLIAGDEMCNELSANILGLDAEDDLAQAGAIDALKEILNVIAGHVLTGLAGDQSLFDMHPPDAERLSDRQWADLELSPETLCFNVDEHPMLMQLQLEGE